MNNVSLSVPNVNFKEKNQPQKIDAIVTTPPIEDKEKSNAAKYVIGATALAAIVIGGFATKGKLWGKTTNPFKKAGIKFENKFALDKNGNLFTGKIEHQTKNGSHFVFEYKDGQLVKSSKNVGKYQDLENNFVKNYKRNDGGKITEIERQVLKPNGKTEVRNALIHYGEDGKINYTETFDGLTHAKVNDKMLCICDPAGKRNTYHRNGNIFEERFEDGRYNIYNDYGNLCEQKLADGTVRMANISSEGYKTFRRCSNGEKELNWFHRDGKFCRKEILPDGTTREWGTYDHMFEECKPDGTKWGFKKVKDWSYGDPPIIRKYDGCDSPSGKNYSFAEVDELVPKIDLSVHDKK